MCGIVGLFRGNASAASARKIIDEMSETLAHRGPDDQGIWESLDGKLVFGHRRLSIVDLSSSGAQPMCSKDMRYALVFNGEIYNHIHLRAELSESFDITFSGTSDSEVLLYALIHWGTSKTLRKLRGMFAFGFYSKDENKLFLARDRSGEKPLYYGSFGGFWGFASELKALRACKGFEDIIDKRALNTFFKYGYIPAPLSIWKGIKKLKPGSCLVFDLSKGMVLSEELYWRPSPGYSSHSNKYDAQLESKLHKDIIQAVDEQLIADVPVGAFLSGGVDSSLVVGIAKRELGQDIKTFSIGFDDIQYDESIYAREVANRLDVDHFSWKITSKDALDVIPRLAEIFDEPFGDPSAIPTFLVSQFAKSEVTVALTGDGADELFSGYSRYHSTRFHAAWLLKRAIPFKKGILNSLLKAPNVRVSSLLASKNFADFYGGYTSHWHESPVLTGDAPLEPNYDLDGDLYNQMRIIDFETYLPDCILTKVDRCAMANSLESRVPFLDSRVIDTAFEMNMRSMLRDRSGKLVLKNILSKYLPSRDIDRPKQGFSIPLERWLLHDLRELVEHYLAPSVLEAGGLLNQKLITHYWIRLKRGESALQQLIWLVFIFQLWLEENKS